jgi:hypothetical protein
MEENKHEEWLKKKAIEGAKELKKLIGITNTEINMKLKEFLSNEDNLGKYFVYRHNEELKNFPDYVFFVCSLSPTCTVAVRSNGTHFDGHGEVIRPATEEEIEKYRNEYIEYQKSVTDFYNQDSWRKNINKIKNKVSDEIDQSLQVEND